MRHRFFALVAAALALALFFASPVFAGGEDPPAAFVRLTNEARAANGLASYAVAADLADVAAQQAQRMAAQHQIFHNPNLGSDVSNWRAVGENVGVGASPPDIHDAFMASPHHRDNILSGTYTEIGVGVAQGDDGRMYVSEVFRLPMNSESAADPEPAPDPEPVAAPAPAPRHEAPPAPTPDPEPTTSTTELTTTTTSTTVAPTTTRPYELHAQPVAAVRNASSDSGKQAAALVAALFVGGVLAAHAVVLRRAPIRGNVGR